MPGVTVGPFRLAVLFLVALAFTAPFSRGQDHSDSTTDNGNTEPKDKAPKRYLTFEVGYVGSAGSGNTEEASGTNIEFNDRFSGRIEVRPESSVGSEVIWYPRGDSVSLHGTVDEKSTSIGEMGGEGGSSAIKTSVDTYTGHPVCEGSLVNALVRINPEQKTYDLQFTLMPDMATTQEAVVERNVWKIVGDPTLGGGKNGESSQNTPLSMGPGQMSIGYDNYQIAVAVTGVRLEGEPGVLAGVKRIPLPKPAGWSGYWHLAIDVTWNINISLPPVELIVTSKAYDKWRPTATLESAEPERNPASGIEFIATLQPTDGKKYQVLPKIASVEWRLSNTSREPGISMNYPYKSDDRRPDLELAADDDTPTEDKEKQVLTFREPDGPVTRATIYPFDWGAWTTLRVTAKLADGRSIEGILKGAPGVTGSIKDIPVPSSPPGSHIALSWLRKYCPGWHSDDADDDKSPAGRPGVDGDGFTVYEEYRGFNTSLWSSRHVSTDPTQKDIFVRNSAGFEAREGIDKFIKLSKLTKHLLFPYDLPRAEQNERVVNCNVGAGPSKGPQTAIFLNLTESHRHLNDLIPPNSRPATVATVWVPIGFSQLGELSSGLHTYVYFNTFARLSETVVHMVMQSMFQCVGVDRPGPSGKIAMLIFVPAAQSPEGKAYFLLDGQKVLCLSEDGRDFAVLLERQWELSVTPTAVYPPMHSDPNDSSRYRRVLIGTKGSAHSGPEDCVMRDWFADYYQSRDSRDGLPIYYYSSDEKPGTRLGETRKGTGVNQDTHLPEPRYGDSNVAEPAFHQLVVKDKSP